MRRQFSEIKKKKIIAIAASSNHSFALTADGELFGWGDNRYGCLGFKKFKRYTRPKRFKNTFDDSPVVAIACGHYTNLALTKNGKIFAWGNHGQARLNQGPIYTPLEPTDQEEIFGQKNFVAIGANGNLQMAATDQGETYFWTLEKGSKTIRAVARL